MSFIKSIVESRIARYVYGVTEDLNKMTVLEKLLKPALQVDVLGASLGFDTMRRLFDYGVLGARVMLTTRAFTKGAEANDSKYRWSRFSLALFDLQLLFKHAVFNIKNFVRGCVVGACVYGSGVFPFIISKIVIPLIQFGNNLSNGGSPIPVVVSLATLLPVFYYIYHYQPKFTDFDIYVIASSVFSLAPNLFFYFVFGWSISAIQLFFAVILAPFCEECVREYFEGQFGFLEWKSRFFTPAGCSAYFLHLLLEQFGDHHWFWCRVFVHSIWNYTALTMVTAALPAATFTIPNLLLEQATREALVGVAATVLCSYASFKFYHDVLLITFLSGVSDYYIIVKRPECYQIHFVQSCVIFPVYQGEEQTSIYIPNDVSVEVFYWEMDVVTGDCNFEPSGRTEMLARNWNKLMHCIHGNIDYVIKDDQLMLTSKPKGLNPDAPSFKMPYLLNDFLELCVNKNDEQLDKLFSNYKLYHNNGAPVDKVVIDRLRATINNGKLTSFKGDAPKVEASPQRQSYYYGESGKFKKSSMIKATMTRPKGDHYKPDVNSKGNFIVPYTPSAQFVARPSVQDLRNNPNKARIWLSSYACTLAKRHSNSSKRFQPLGNGPAAALWNMGTFANMSDSQLQALLLRARVDWLDTALDTKAPPKAVMSDFIDFSPIESQLKPCVSVGSILVTSSDEFVSKFAHLFKRDKPVLKAIGAYLDDTLEPGRLPLLRESVAKFGVILAHYRDTKQGKKFHKQQKVDESRLVAEATFQEQLESTTVPITKSPPFEVTKPQEIKMIGYDPELTATMKAQFMSLSLLATEYARQLPELASIIKVICLVTGVMDASSWLGVVANITQFLLSIDVPDRLKKAFSSIQECVAEFSSMVPSGDIKQGLIDVMGSFVNNSVMTSLWEIIQSIGIFQVLNVFKCDWGLFKYIREGMIVALSRTKSSFTLGGRIMLFIELLFKKIMECARLGSLAPLFNERDTPAHWFIKADALLNYQDIIVSRSGASEQALKELKQKRLEGIIPAEYVDQISESMFFDDVKDHLERGERLKSLFASEDLRRRESLMGELRMLVATLTSTATTSSMRVAPFGVAFAGPAGTGKTVAAEALYKAIGRQNGYSLEASSKFYYQVDSNFQEGYTSRQWCVIGDDMDQSVAAPVAGQMNHCTFINKLVNNAAWNIEQSDVNQKGRHASRSVLFIYNTNYYTFRAKEFYADPAVIRRRIPWMIRLKPKPEFAKGEMLDPIKASVSETHDMWDVDVLQYDPTKNPSEPDSIPYTLVMRCSFSDMIKHLCGEFKLHMDRQRKLLAMTGTDHKYCPSCFLDSDRKCGCIIKEVEVKQGFLEVVETLTIFAKFGNNLLTRPYWGASLGLAGTLSLFVFSRSFKERIKGIIQESNVGKLIPMLEDTLSTVSVLGKVAASIAVFAAITKCISALVQLYNSWFQKTHLQARVDNSSDAVKTNWVRVSQDYRTGFAANPATWTKDELIRQVQDCTFEIVTEVTILEGQKLMKSDMKVHGLQVAVHALVVPKHCLFNHDGSMVSTVKCISSNGHVTICEVSGATVKCGAMDLAMICNKQLVGRPSLVDKFWVCEDDSISMFDEGALIRSKEVIDLKFLKHGKNPHTSLSEVSSAYSTQNGDCGYAYIARVGTQWKIVALHVAMRDLFQLLAVTQYCVGDCISSLTLKQMLHSLGTVSQGVVIPRCLLQKPGIEVSFEHFPLKSEVWTAVTNHGISISPIGTAVPQVMGNSFVSKCYDPPFKVQTMEIVKDFTGDYEPFVKPHAKGRMEDGIWVSPCQNAIQHRSVPINQDYLLLALLDFVYPMQFCDNSGYRDISRVEAITGIPNSHIGGVDMTTSVGMPFNGKKKTFFSIEEVEIDNNEVRRDVFVDGRVVDHWDEIDSILNGGNIPAPISIFSYKDEPISKEKLKACKIRLFNCLSAVTNLRTKQQTAPVKCWRRANWRITESAVGINMCSTQSTQLVMEMKKVNPNLDRILEGDFRWFDKTLLGDFVWSSAVVHMAISYLIGGDWETTFNMVLSMGQTVYIMKNDLFQLGSANPSGGDPTVEMNGDSNSIANRYVYYRRCFPNGLPLEIREQLNVIRSGFMSDPSLLFKGVKTGVPEFRLLHSLFTYGDDLLKAISPDYQYDLDDEVKFFAEVGLHFTDGQKGDNIILRPISQVYFLKRRFVWNPEINAYFVPISLKTLGRMLSISRHSTLSHHDHAATTIVEVVRELVYHGREMFNRYVPVLDKIANDLNLHESKYYIVKSYDEYMGDITKGEFITWT